MPFRSEDEFSGAGAFCLGPRVSSRSLSILNCDGGDHGFVS
jgi:hypothetical protein